MKRKCWISKKNMIEEKGEENKATMRNGYRSGG
jgi:hypothetical protein